MKTKKNLIAVLISIMLASCATTSYYQVYKASPTEQIVMKDNNLVFEDENCIVTYNLWTDGGNIGFNFYNKTDKNIYLNMEESFFILNGISYNYYRNRVFTNSRSAAATTTTATTKTLGMMSSSGYSVSTNEEKIVCIPSKTAKVISEYTINETVIRDCDLFKYPTKKQVKSKYFTKDQSPLVFSNRIAYSVGQSNNLLKIVNEFYVSEITNYPVSEIIASKYEEYCGQKKMTMVKYFKTISADRFYIGYSKGQDVWKH